METEDFWNTFLCINCEATWETLNSSPGGEWCLSCHTELEPEIIYQELVTGD